MNSFQVSLIFAFLAMIGWGVGDFLIQKTVRKVGDFQTLLWIDLVAAVVLLPFVWQDFPAMFIWDNARSLLLMTLAELLYSILLFKAYNKGKLSVVEMILIGELPFTIILGLLFFKETLSWSQLLVVIAIITGVCLISKSRRQWWEQWRYFGKKSNFIWEKGALLALAAVIFSALYNFLITSNARNISAFTAVWFPWTFGSLFLLGYIWYSQGLRSFWRSSFNYRRLILITALIDTAAWLFYALATQREELSIITTIVAGYAVIAMILGVKFNGERISLWQYIGAVIVMSGVIVMGLISK